MFLTRLLLAAVTGLTIAACSSSSEQAEDDENAIDTEAAVTSGTAPADPNATPETKTVFANLASFDFGSADPFDHRTLIGVQDADVSNRSTNGLTKITSDIANVTGKSPALVGYEVSSVYKSSLSMFDTGGFRNGRNALHDLVIDKHSKGTLVSLVWHMRCPKASANDRDLFAPNECPADYNLEELLARKANGQEGRHFREWRALLDELAELLWSLKDSQGRLIPIQIRPFHEFTGNWFWWGADRNSGATYAAAWREMVTYLRDGRGLHNVLWVFCPAAPTTNGFESFYPGDAYVDVVGFDRYDFNDNTFARGYEADLRKIGAFARSHKKVAAVTEIGRDLVRFGPNSDPTWFSRAVLGPLKAQGRSFAYVGLWRNAPWEKFIPEPNDGAIADDLKTMANDSGALMSGRHNLYLPLHVPPGT
jgi:mannan endo-1,4-beta-mannosidase